MTTLLWPVEGHTRITSPFGERVHPITGERGHHNGIDIACPEGTPLRSPFPGIVRAVWIDERFGGGLSLSVESESGVLRLGFAHLSNTIVARGMRVDRGELIAYTGGTPGTRHAGSSTGPHLHMTLRRTHVYHTPTNVDPFSERWVDAAGQPVAQEATT